jgi:hypothetical protein
VLPKIHKYTLGQRIDSLFIEVIEAISAASFTKSEDKKHYINIAIRKVDTLKVLLMILWETKSIDNKKYLIMSVKIEDIGKMLGGWLNHLQMQNSLNA